MWNQKFEKSLVNKPLAERNLSYADFIESVQGRIVDLMDMFDDNRVTFWHPAFKGSASIKYVLPVLVPSMSYKETVEWQQIHGIV